MLSTRSFLSSAIVLLATSTTLLHHAAAQVTTSCQPLNTTNCPADPAFGMDYTFYFNQTPISGTWDTTAGTVDFDANNGATFTINQKGDSPTIRTGFYFFFGRVEVWMKTAPGTGIISSTMLLSDDLDEIDWEFMGGNNSYGETNYFGKGQPDYHNALYYPVNGGVQDDYHNYTTLWTNSSLQYYIDGQLVRTLLPKDANNTHNYPQTPMRLSIGIWAGGDPSNANGTIAWAGGETDYSKGPFTMYVRSVRVTDFQTGSKQYTYGDQSGSWQSIRIEEGNSTVQQAITAPPTPTLAERWASLSPTAKIAIYASSAGLGAALFAWVVFYCIRQRRRGAREARLAEQRAEEERLELERFKKAGVDPDSFVVENSEYDAKEMRREGLSNGDAYSVPNSPSTTSPREKAWEAAAVGGAGGAAVAGMRSPAPGVPLLRDAAQSPRIASPGPGAVGAMGGPRGAYANLNGNAPASPYGRSRSGSSAGNGALPYDRSRSGSSSSPGGALTPLSSAQGALISPIRTPSPGMAGGAGPPPRFPPPASPANRSFSSPNAQMRVASPGPMNGGYGGPRLQSPAPMAAPQPQRSYTAGGYGAPRGGGGAYGGNGGQYGGGGSGGYGGNGGDEYWGNGGWR